MKSYAALGALAAFFLLAVPGWGRGDDAPASASPASNAQGKSAYDFDQAIQSYLKGDSQKSIQQLDESLSLDPDNQRAKVFLLKILVERGSRLFLAKQYPKAYDYLSRAYHMDPNNEQVRQMFDIAAKQVAPQAPVTQVMLIPKEMQTEMLKEQAAKNAQAQGVSNVTLSSRTNAAQGRAAAGSRGNLSPVYAEPAPMESGANAGNNNGGIMIAEQYAKNAAAMMNLLNGFQQRQEHEMDKFMVPMDRLQRMYYQSEQDRKTFMNQLDGRFKNVLGDMSFQRRMVIYGFLAGLVMLGFVVYGFYMIILRMRSKREALVMKYQQEMLKMVRDMAALPGAGGLSGLPMGNQYRLPNNAPQFQIGGGYFNANANANAGNVGGYPQQVVPGDGNANMGGTPNPSSMPNMGGMPNPAPNDPLFQLDQIILTGNLKERAMAAMRMLSLNPERALDVIQKMMTAEDSFQRENMAFSLGEQYHPLTLDLLINALTDSERRVALVAYRALKRLERQPEEVLPSEARNMVLAAIKNAPADLQDKKRGGV